MKRRLKRKGKLKPKLKKTKAAYFDHEDYENEGQSQKQTKTVTVGFDTIPSLNFSQDFNLKVCSQCTLDFDTTAHSPIQEACGHIKCRACFIQNLSKDLNYCPDCHSHEGENGPEPVVVEDELPVPAPAGTGTARIKSSDKVQEEENPSSGKSRNSVASQILKRCKKNRRSKNAPLPQFIVITTATEEAPSAGSVLLYKCVHCKKKFKTKSNIRYHQFCGNVSDTAKPFNCEECGRGFVSKDHFKYHLQTHTGEKPYACPVCQKRFIQQGKVIRHMSVHSTTKTNHIRTRSYACRYCDTKFSDVNCYKKHVRLHDVFLEDDKQFKCQICANSFMSKWELQRHLRSHPYQCGKCTRSFGNSKDLRRHMMIHFPHRPFKCETCGTAFRRQDNLYRHSKNTHGVDMERRNSVSVSNLQAKRPKQVPRVTLQLEESTEGGSKHDCIDDSINNEDRNENNDSCSETDSSSVETIIG